MSTAEIWDSMFRGEFAKAMQASLSPEVANVMRIVQDIPSSGRRERQTWMTPVPAPTESTGVRNYGLLDYVSHEVAIKDYDNGFQIKNTDLDDEQMGLWKAKPAELVDRCRKKIVKLILQKAAAAASSVNFEGEAAQYHAADSHKIGAGDNLLGSTGSGGGTPAVASLYVGGPVKPLIWYNRARPQIESDAGTKEASKAMVTKWWCDFRGAAAFGFWWDFVLDEFTGLPTVEEFKTALGEILAAYRGFQLPDGEYVHGQTQFDRSNWILLVRPEMESVVRQVRDNSVISLVSNEFSGMFDYIVTSELGA